MDIVREIDDVMLVDRFLKDLAEVLEINYEKLTTDYPLNEDNWSSLSVVSTIAIVNEHFGVLVDGKALGKCCTFGEVCNLVALKKRSG